MAGNDDQSGKPLRQGEAGTGEVPRLHQPGFVGGDHGNQHPDAEPYTPSISSKQSNKLRPVEADTPGTFQADTPVQADTTVRADTGRLSPNDSQKGDDDDRSLYSMETGSNAGVDAVAETGSAPMAETGSSPNVMTETAETGSTTNVIASAPVVAVEPIDVQTVTSPSPAPDLAIRSPQSASSSSGPPQQPPTPDPACASGPYVSGPTTANGAKKSQQSKPARPLCMKQDSLLLGHLRYPACHVSRSRLLTYTGETGHSQHVLTYSHADLVDWGGFPGLVCKASVFRLRNSLPKQACVLALLTIATMLCMQHIMNTIPAPDTMPEEVRRLEDKIAFFNQVQDNTVDVVLQYNGASQLHRLLQDDGGGGDGDDGDGEDEEEEEGDDKKLDPKAYWLMQVSPLIDLSGYANTLVVFLLGVFLSVSISRWWRLRSVHFQAILKATKNIVYSMAAILPGAKYDQIRRQVARHALLSFRLIFICARTRPCVTHNELAALQDEGLLTPSETKALLRGMERTSAKKTPFVTSIKSRWNFEKGGFDLDLAEIPWQWNAQLVHVLFKQGCFPPPVMAMLHRLCLEARGGLDGIVVQLNSQLPFAYAHLISLLVQGAVILNSVKCGILLALADSVLAMVCQVVFSLCLCMVYLGLLALTAVIADPLGDDIIDLPSAHLLQQLWHNCSMLDSMRRPPEQYRIELKERAASQAATEQ